MTNNVGLGYFCCVISALFFGSNYVPVKKLELGEGVFFAFTMSLGIFMVGFLVNVVQGFPKFEVRASIGGMLWAVGNLMVVPIVNSIGLGLGMMIWSAVGMLVGWASAKFGILFIEKVDVDFPILNTFGVALALAALYVSSKIDGNSTSVSANQQTASSSRGGDIRRGDEDAETFLQQQQSSSALAHERRSQQHSFGITLSIISGLLYGVNFNPAQSLIEDKSGLHSDEAFDYVFSHFCGIFLCTLSAFVIHYYHVVRKSSDKYPDLRQETVIPAIISGIMWGIAQAAWFVANRELSLAIAFPIISTMPAIIAASIGYFYFGEMQGERNVKLLIASNLMRIVSVLFIANSR
jgi:glucose uptake protein GlcU